jgi:probable rRNA maturation factor
MVTVQVKRGVKLVVDKSILVQAAEHVLGEMKTTADSDLGIVIASDSLLHQLNLQYRKTDSATDVLSFPSAEIDPDTSRLYLGDIIISLPRAQAQASAEGHTLADELVLLVVHGTLHLLGYDHEQDEDKKRMQIAQDTMMKQLGHSFSTRL